MSQLANPVTECGKGEQQALPKGVGKAFPGDALYATTSPTRKKGTHLPPPGEYVPARKGPQRGVITLGRKSEKSYWERHLDQLGRREDRHRSEEPSSTENCSKSNFTGESILPRGTFATKGLLSSVRRDASIPTFRRIL